MRKDYLLENAAKNILIILLLALAYAPIQSFFLTVNPGAYDSILFVVSILILAFLFADYAFDYPPAKLKNKCLRYLGHAETFLIMLGTGLLLEATLIVLELRLGVVPTFFQLIAALFYVSLVLYDFWDLMT